VGSVDIRHLHDVWKVSKLRVVRPGALVHIVADFDVIEDARLRAQAEGRPEPQIAARTLATEDHPRKLGTVSQRTRWLRAFLTHRYGGEAVIRNARHSAGDRVG
jgi:hypothetical protein